MSKALVISKKSVSSVMNERQLLSELKHEFIINIGVKQGDGASPELFILFFDRIYPYLKEYYQARRISTKQRQIYTIACF